MKQILHLKGVLFALFFSLFSLSVFSQTYTVTNNLDDGSAGSLRDAITQVNAGAFTTIVINNVGTISLASPLTPFANPVYVEGAGADVVTINANGQSGSGFVFNKIAQLYGVTMTGFKIGGGGIAGVRVNTNNANATVIGSLAKPVVINDCQYGIYLNNVNNVTVRYTQIGTNFNGNTAVNNSLDGIYIDNSNNTIIENSLISGNNYGIQTSNIVSNTTIRNNIIGLGKDGTTVLGNGGAGSAGIHTNFGTSQTLIDNNTISGNSWGIAVVGGTSFTTITNNRIGTSHDGTSAKGNTILGISVASATTNTFIENNTISANTTYGIISVQDNVSIKSNKIGTNASGSAALTGQNTGIYLKKATGDISGTNIEANTISGNSTGIYLYKAINTTIKANKIGLDISGSNAIANTIGIQFNTSSFNTVGGNSTTDRNIISGNGTYGLQLIFSSVNAIFNNYIGTNATGTAARPNGYAVQLKDYSNYNLLGETSKGNLISGNNFGGILVELSSYNKIGGNLIGTQADGVSALGNNITGSTAAITLGSGSANNTIGGDGQGNTIAFDKFNAGKAVNLTSATDDRNVIRANSIFCVNGGGITLAAGSNNDKPAPTILFATVYGGTSYVNGTAQPNDIIDLYKDNATCNTMGRVHLGFVSADGAGQWSFSGFSASYGESLTTTATDFTSGTSPFSTPFLIQNPFIVLNTSSSVSVPYSLSWCINLSNNTAGTQNIGFNIPTTDAGYIAGTNHWRISQNSTLNITDNMSIDAYTQTGASTNTLSVGNNAVLKIEVRFLGTFGNTFDVTGTCEAIFKGLVINNNTNGIGGTAIDFGANAIRGTVAGCFLGTDITGNTMLSNKNGIITNNSEVTIGGSNTADRNLISGSIDFGIQTNANQVLIQNNYIGTNAAGTAAIPNKIGILNSAGMEFITIRENLVSGNNTMGINIGGSNIFVYGNKIGTDANGTNALSNKEAGIYVGTGNQNVQIGSMTNNKGNIIAYNGSVGTFSGIDLGDVQSINIYNNQIFKNTENGIKNLGGSGLHEIKGNFIGTNSAQAAGLGNTQNGIYVEIHSNEVLIGALNEGNIIAYNALSGIYLKNTQNVKMYHNQIYKNSENGIRTQNANNNTQEIRGNFIGTNATQAAGLGNTQSGILIESNTNNISIGGNQSPDANVIVNNNKGVELKDAQNITIRKNFIGTDNTATLNRGNLKGIDVLNSSRIGIGAASLGNTIAFNQNGIFLDASSGENTFAAIQQNSIFQNTLGIDLNPVGLTPNDTDDTDGTTPAANRLQNFPEFPQSAELSGTNNLTIYFKVPSLPANSDYPLTVEFFKADGTQGRYFLGTYSYTAAQANTVVTYNFTSPIALTTTDFLVATSTSSDEGNGAYTSEFSALCPIKSLCYQPIISSVSPPSYSANCVEILGSAATLSISNPHSSNPTYSVDWNGDGIFDNTDLVLSKDNTLSISNIIVGFVIKNPVVKANLPQTIANCNSNPYPINAVGTINYSKAPEITSIEIVDATTCSQADGKLIIGFAYHIQDEVYNIDYNNDGNFDAFNVPIDNKTRQVVVQNIRAGTKFGDVIRLFGQISKCTSLFNYTGQMPLANISKVPFVRPNFYTISPNYALKINFSNYESGITYHLTSPEFSTSFTNTFTSISEPIKIVTKPLTKTQTFVVRGEGTFVGCQNTFLDSFQVVVVDGIYQSELDILKIFFDSTGGKNWTNKWDFSNSKNLYGVSYFGGNVTEIILENNNLIDKIPAILKKLPNLQKISVKGNKLTFWSVHEIIGAFPSFSYEDQAKIGNLKDTTMQEGEFLEVEVLTKGSNLNYQWYKDGKPLAGQTNKHLIFNSLLLSDSGNYYLEVSSSIAPLLKLYSNTFVLSVYPKWNDADLDPLRRIFADLDGKNWTNKWDFSKSVYKFYGLVFEKGKLVSINLKGNKLKGVIPFDAFWDRPNILSHLKILNLSDNQIVGAVPATLSNLKKLEELDLSHNQIDQVQENFFESPEIRVLWLAYNQLKGLPRIDRLKKLRHLFIQNNQFVHLPDGIGNLEFLETLDFSHNQISVFNFGFEKLKNLDILYFNYNFFASLPQEIGFLPKIRDLRFNGNLLQNLPTSLLTAPKLSYLSMAANYLDFGDIEPFAQLKNRLQTVYSPQARFGKAENRIVKTGEILRLNVETQGTANRYRWYKNGKALDVPVTAFEKELLVRGILQEDAGRYWLVVTNSLAPDLELFSKEIEVNITCNLPNLDKIVLKGDTVFCQNERINTTLKAPRLPEGYTWDWLKDEQPIGLKNVETLTINEVGAYSLMVITPQNCVSVLPQRFLVANFAKPDISIKSNGSDLRIESRNALPLVSFQWFLENQPIKDAFRPIWKAQKLGKYYVKVIDVNGCTSLSPIFELLPTATEKIHKTELEVYPNPSNEFFQVRLLDPKIKTAQIRVFDINGKEFFRKDLGTGVIQEHIQNHLWAKGIYMLQIVTDTDIYYQKISKD